MRRLMFGVSQRSSTVSLLVLLLEAWFHVGILPSNVQVCFFQLSMHLWLDVHFWHAFCSNSPLGLMNLIPKLISCFLVFARLSQFPSIPMVQLHAINTLPFFCCLSTKKVSCIQHPCSLVRVASMASPLSTSVRQCSFSMLQYQTSMSSLVNRTMAVVSLMPICSASVQLLEFCVCLGDADKDTSCKCDHFASDCVFHVLTFTETRTPFNLLHWY